ncbi:cell division protein FtsW [Gordonia araii NBRC 100433]|uniref:Probable peptidoglycan glycosyltransferase FtsW n=1 Tax=Gordonia araii NBRC 100433 TaxID=1073574 RepID=G7H2U1_9ACTN|nr:putative lipid II flippase FtsW [Gordonia araii]NNG98508.1 putative lipid II flippase FtsW [Gordonia araii NBRC 100433]GAB10166.1 cell division protein FtsW [Gordonia araii NBRC 100433]
MTTAEKAAGKSGSASGSSKTDASEGAASTDAPENESLLAWPKVIVEAVRNLLARPTASFHLVVGMALVLTVLGLVMVLSASSVEGYSRDGSAYSLFTTQVIFALLGLGVFYLTVRLPVRLVRRAAGPMIVLTTILLALVLVPGIGTLSQGARRWFVVYGLSVQPSELVKVALCVWGAHLLASRRRDGVALSGLLVPLIPVAALISLLILLEPNLSTTITIAVIVAALLWFAGLPVRVFASFVVSGAVIAVGLALIEGYRSQRVFSFLGAINDPQGAGYQARQALYALANGGVFGVGLGQSRAKWNYLPNAHNDFIFAIVGEELGLIGAFVVIGLFLGLMLIGMRIAMRSEDPFLKLMSSTITVLITAQAFVNIGYVVGLLPVTGIQLPLVSAGGTSTLTMLAMLGLLANAARHEPESVVTLAHQKPVGWRARLWRLPAPVAYRPTRAEKVRERMAGRPRRSEPVARRRATAPTARPISAGGRSTAPRSRVTETGSIARVDRGGRYRRGDGDTRYRGTDPAPRRSRGGSRYDRDGRR